MNYLPYLFFFIFLLFLFFVETSKNGLGILSKKNITIFVYYSFFLITFIFICCRGYVGADWKNYKPFFESAPSFFSDNELIKAYLIKSHWEKGYTLFNIVCKSVTDNYLFLQFFSALIDLILLHIVFKEYCPKQYLLAWMIFFAFSGFDFEILYLRNTKSMYLFLISLKYLEKKKRCYFFLNLIGVLFHVSAVIYFPLFFFLRSNKKGKLIYLLLFFVGLLFFFLKIQWLKEFIGFGISLVSSSATGNVRAYLVDQTFSAEYSFSLGMLERLITFCIIFMCHEKLSEKGLGSVIKLFYIYIYVYLFCAEFGIIIARVTALFIPSYWILYPCVYSLLRKPGKIIFLVFFLSYCCLKIVSAMSVNWAFYENFLFSEPNPNIGKFLNP